MIVTVVILTFIGLGMRLLAHYAQRWSYNLNVDKSVVLVLGETSFSLLC